MMKGRYILLVLIGVMLICSCAPSRYILDAEMRYASRAGVDLTDKNVTIAFGQDSIYPNDPFLKSMAEGFAWNLKDRYQSSIGKVDVRDLKSASNYANRDSLLNLLMKTGADVVFLLDKVDLLGSSFSFVMRCYDAMNQKDKVQLFSGSSVAESLSSKEEVIAQGWEAGKEVAMAFEPQWKHEQFSLYYFESEPWYTALEKAQLFDWKSAMDIWMNHLQAKDQLKRACAAYNLATACYLLGDYELATRWLDYADENADLLVSSGLRKRINIRK